MRKGKLIKALRKDFDIKVKRFSTYDFEIIKASKIYYLKVVNISSTHQITINSKHIWNLKKGKINGIKFKTLNSELLNLKEFNKFDNKIIVFTDKPYKVFKALNESDLKDISDEKVINDIFVTYELSKLIKHIK